MIGGFFAIVTGLFYVSMLLAVTNGLVESWRGRSSFWSRPLHMLGVWMAWLVIGIIFSVVCFVGCGTANLAKARLFVLPDELHTREST